jgi:hypothetical protein
VVGFNEQCGVGHLGRDLQFELALLCDCLLLQNTGPGQIGVSGARADGITEVHREVPGRSRLAPQRAQRIAEAALNDLSGGAREHAGRADELRPSDTGGGVARRQVEGRKPLIRQAPDRDVVGLHLLARGLDIGARS